MDIQNFLSIRNIKFRNIYRKLYPILNIKHWETPADIMGNTPQVTSHADLPAKQQDSTTQNHVLMLPI